MENLQAQEAVENRHRYRSGDGSHESQRIRAGVQEVYRSTVRVCVGNQKVAIVNGNGGQH